MKTALSKILIGLCVIGAAILLVLATLGASRLGWKTTDGDQTQAINAGELPPSPVSVKTVDREEGIEITDSYPGMIEPFEHFSLGFEIGGRVVALGVNQSGEALDDGDRVEQGQMLARLDDRVLLARVEEIQAQISEAKARRTDAIARQSQAQADWNRLQELRENNPDAVTEAGFEQAETDVKVADAQLDVVAAQASMLDAQLAIAEKALEDAQLICPVAGVISRRLVNPGESINANQRVFEVLQVDKVLLVVGVPEAYVGEIRIGQPAHVEMLARNRFRHARRDHPDCVVYRVEQAANETTGLFGVEILIDNSEGLLRPGQIGRGAIVVDRVDGYRIARTFTVKRRNETQLFFVDETGFSRVLELKDWIEQGEDLIVADLPENARTIVVRGQHRLVDGQKVRFVEPESSSAPTPPTANPEI